MAQTKRQQEWYELFHNDKREYNYNERQLDRYSDKKTRPQVDTKK